MNAITTVEPKDFGLEESKAQELTSGLSTILEERSALAENYKDVIKLEITPETIPQFRELRLRIRDNRTKGIEKWHKVNKEFFLTGGRFVDAIKNKETAENLRMEESLMEGEKHFENIEKERLANLNKERIEAISPYVEDTTGLELSSMDEDVWDAYFSAKKAKFEALLAEQKRIEQERIENEKKDSLERQRRFEIAPFSQFLKDEPDYREMDNKVYSTLKSDLLAKKKAYDKEQEEIRLENERLKKEREAEIEKQRKSEEQRLAKEKKEREEREAEEKKQREIQAKKDAELQEQLRKEREEASRLRKEKLDAEIAELKRIEAEEKKAEELAKAPVKDKLNLWVDSFELPNVSESNPTVSEITSRFESFKKWAKNEIEKL